MSKVFLYRIPDSTLFEIAITEGLLERALAAVVAIQAMTEEEIVPEPTLVRGRCVECEYVNFCGDIW